MGARLWLDDVRKPPWGYDLWAKTAAEAIQMLQDHDVDHCSLDHDLAEEHYADAVEGTGYSEAPRSIDRSKYKEPTGYGVVEWMRDNNRWPAEIHVHTLNRRGAEDMMAVIRKHAPDEIVFRRVKPHTLG